MSLLFCPIPLAEPQVWGPGSRGNGRECKDGGAPAQWMRRCARGRGGGRCWWCCREVFLVLGGGGFVAGNVLAVFCSSTASLLPLPPPPPPPNTCYPPTQLTHPPAPSLAHSLICLLSTCVHTPSFLLAFFPLLFLEACAHSKLCGPFSKDLSRNFTGIKLLLPSRPLRAASLAQHSTLQCLHFPYWFQPLQIPTFRPPSPTGNPDHHRVNSLCWLWVLAEECGYSRKRRPHSDPTCVRHHY